MYARRSHLRGSSKQSFLVSAIPWAFMIVGVAFGFMAISTKGDQTKPDEAQPKDKAA